MHYSTDWVETRKRSVDLYRYHNTHNYRFGNVYSRDFQIYITDVRAFDAPEKDITFQSIPGRNGDLTIDNNRWKNVDVVYTCTIATDFERNFNAFKKKLYALSGYQRLEDTVHINVFRMGVFREGIEPTVVRKGRTGTFDIRFSCKPQIFLKSGEFSSTVTEATTLYNDGGIAKPIITVYGTGPGNLYVGDCIVQIKALTDQITLDCELMNAYRKVGDGATENKNGDIYAPVFPEFGYGKIPIRWDGGITHIEYIPRSWRF